MRTVPSSLTEAAWRPWGPGHAESRGGVASNLACSVRVPAATSTANTRAAVLLSPVMTWSPSADRSMAWNGPWLPAKAASWRSAGGSRWTSVSLSSSPALTMWPPSADHLVTSGGGPIGKLCRQPQGVRHRVDFDEPQLGVGADRDEVVNRRPGDAVDEGARPVEPGDLGETERGLPAVVAVVSRLGHRPVVACGEPAHDPAEPDAAGPRATRIEHKRAPQARTPNTVHHIPPELRRNRRDRISRAGLCLSQGNVPGFCRMCITFACGLVFWPWAPLPSGGLTGSRPSAPRPGARRRGTRKRNRCGRGAASSTHGPPSSIAAQTGAGRNLAAQRGVVAVRQEHHLGSVAQAARVEVHAAERDVAIHQPGHVGDGRAGKPDAGDADLGVNDVQRLGEDRRAPSAARAPS